MFNLDEAIANWRRQLVAGGITSADVLNELEGHLREDVERQVQSGADPERALDLAAQRIGRAEALRFEFERAGQKPGAQPRKAAHLFGLRFAALAYLWVLLMGINALLKAEMSPRERLLGFSAVALALVAFGCMRWFHRFLPVLPDKRVRSAIQWVFMIMALAWLPIYTYAVLPGLSLTLGQLLVATLWSINLPPIVLGLTRGMDEAVRRRA